MAKNATNFPPKEVIKWMAELPVRKSGIVPVSRAPVVAFEEYPKMLLHPESDGKRKLMPVIVNNPEQEAAYTAKGYGAAGGDPQAFLTAKLTEKYDDTYRRLDKHVIDSLAKAMDKMASLFSEMEKIHETEMVRLEAMQRTFEDRLTVIEGEMIAGDGVEREHEETATGLVYPGEIEDLRADDAAAGLVPLRPKIADDYADIGKRMKAIKHDFIAALRAPYVPPV